MDNDTNSDELTGGLLSRYASMFSQSEPAQASVDYVPIIQPVNNQITGLLGPATPNLNPGSNCLV